MLAEVTWIVLDGGHGQGGAAVSFEVRLTVLVAGLALVGALWYFGFLGAPAEAAEDDAEEDAAGD